VEQNQGMLVTLFYPIYYIMLTTCMEVKYKARLSNSM